MAEFEPQVVKDPAVQTLLAKVDVAADDRYTSQYPKHWGCEMKVTMKDGRVYCYEVQDPSGSTARPLTRKQVMEKAETLLHAGYAGREQEVIHQLFSLEHAKQMPVLGQ